MGACWAWAHGPIQKLVSPWSLLDEVAGIGNSLIWKKWVQFGVDKKYCYTSWNGGEKKNSFEQEFTNWPNDKNMDRQLAWPIFSVQMMWLLISTRRPWKVQMEKQEPGFGSQYGKQSIKRTCKDIFQLKMICAICHKDEETLNDVTWYYCLPTELWITTTKFFTPSLIILIINS